MDTNRHAGKHAIVTGAANGIGLATALRLAAEGAHVVGLDANPQAIEQARPQLGDAVELLQADITNADDVARVVQAAGDRVDILANVAGIMDHFVPLGELDDELWDRVLAVNLTGPMRLSRAVLPAMVAQGGGAIVTVASEASLRAGASGAAYTASKHGVLGLVRSIAFFYGPKGVRSNAVLPGPVETAIGATAMPTSQWAIERAGVALASMPPVAKPDQVAAVISWLASDEASNVNGAVVTSDGGWSTA